MVLLKRVLLKVLPRRVLGVPIVVPPLRPVIMRLVVIPVVGLMPILVIPLGDVGVVPMRPVPLIVMGGSLLLGCHR